MPQNFPITFKEEQPQVFRGKTFQGLGIDYGLIFNTYYAIFYSIDGDVTKTENLLPEGVEGGYSCLFFDKEEKKLYYTKSDSLYEWPNKLIKDFGTKVWGITKFQKEIVVSLYDSGEIKNIEGKTLFDNLKNSYDLREFQGKLYHTESSGGRGLLETPNEQIAMTGSWTIGLDVSSDGKRIYFGGADQKLYSYDGKEVKTICDVGYIWSINSVKEKNEVIYCTGSYAGIEKITLSDNNDLERKKIITSTLSINSIVHAPIDFINQLKESR